MVRKRELQFPRHLKILEPGLPKLYLPGSETLLRSVRQMQSDRSLQIEEAEIRRSMIGKGVLV